MTDEIEHEVHEVAATLGERLDAVIEQMAHQIRHNGPVAPGFIAELKAIRDEMD